MNKNEEDREQGNEVPYDPAFPDEAEKRHLKLRRELREMMMAGDERFDYWNRIFKL